MTIVLVGLNDQTAPLALWERLFLTGDDLRAALSALRSEVLPEVVILSTCNRLEIYANVSDVNPAIETIVTYLVARLSLPADKLQSHLQIQVDAPVVEHLMRVAAGLESLVVGETEILGQVAGSLRAAGVAGTSGAVLSRLFQAAVHAGKRARTETSISRHTLSVSHAALWLAKRHFPDLTNMNALVIGAGRMAELAVRALKAHGATSVQVINRTFARSQVLAARQDIQVLEWQNLHAALCEADLMITATSAPHPILSIDDLREARRLRPSRPLIVLDIAVPRNVEHGVRQLQDVWLYDLDDLQSVVAHHRARRISEAAQVEAIIVAEQDTYLDWLNSRDAVSTIVALRENAERLAQDELVRAFRRLPDLSDHDREIVAQMAHRIVNKLLHAPTAALRERTAHGSHHSYLHAVQQLFDLEPIEPDE